MAIIGGEDYGSVALCCGVGGVVDGVADCCVCCVGYFCVVAGCGGGVGGGHCVCLCVWGGLLLLVTILTQRGAYVKTHRGVESVGDVESVGNVESAECTN